MPKMTDLFKANLETASRELASLVKETYNATVLTKKVHRIVYDFKNNQYWVETGPAEMLMDTEESLKIKERKKSIFDSASDSEDEGSGKGPKKPSFSMDTQTTRRKKTLPRGITFTEVMTEQTPKPIQEGLAYTHFFPHGITERTVIHLADNSKREQTLVIQSLTGRSELFLRNVPSLEALKP
jgi:hypothetical protein